MWQYTTDSFYQQRCKKHNDMPCQQAGNDDKKAMYEGKAQMLTIV